MYHVAIGSYSKVSKLLYLVYLTVSLTYILHVKSFFESTN